MSENKTKLAIIIPCYNEELVVKATVERLLEVLDGIISKGKSEKGGNAKSTCFESSASFSW